jgi:VanZ family protein
MDRFLAWLARRRAWTLCAIVAYLALTFAAHGGVNDICHQLRESVGSGLYNVVLTIGFIVLLSAFSIAVIVRLARDIDWPVKLFYWAVSVGLSVGAYCTLFVLNSEAVHFIQYAVLAVPIYALTRRFARTVLIATFCGAVDEGWQYWVVYGDRLTHYDFNDVVLNLLGAGLGVAFLWITCRRPVIREGWRRRTVRAQLASPAFVAAGLAVALFLASYAIGIVCYYPDQKSFHWSVVLRRGRPVAEEFWEHTDWGKTYHTLRPGEGLAILVLLLGFYLTMDYRLTQASPALASARPAGLKRPLPPVSTSPVK